MKELWSWSHQDKTVKDNQKFDCAVYIGHECGSHYCSFTMSNFSIGIFKVQDVPDGTETHSILPAWKTGWLMSIHKLKKSYE